MDNANPCALVTGAASGTGLAIASRFLKEGYGVFISSRREEDAKAAASALGNGAFGVKLDPSDGEAGVAKAFSEIRERGCALNAAVLNAANLGMGMNALSAPLELWSEVIQTNVVWNFDIARQAAIMMKERGCGSILFIGSNTCRRAIPERSAYIASKGALLSLSKALAVELGRYGIRSNCILSGPIMTSRWASLSESARKAKIARSPLNRIASFEDIAGAAYFLSSSEASDITGSELAVDGGLDANLAQ